MSGLQYFAISLLAAIAGIFGNLLAAIIEGSVGRFTALQTGGMVAGVFIAIILTYLLQQRRSHGGREIEGLKKGVESLRQELKRQRQKYGSGVPWKISDIETWQNRQREIEELKRKIKEKGEDIPYDPLDDEPPPRLSCCVRTIGLVRTLLAFLLLSSLSLGLASVASAKIQRAYLDYIATPTPTLAPTPTTAPTLTPTRMPAVTLTCTLTTALEKAAPTPQLQEQETVTAEQSAADETATSEPDAATPVTTDTPLPTSTPTVTSTPTPTPTDTPTVTSTPTPTETPTVISTPMPAPTDTLTVTSTPMPTPTNTGDRPPTPTPP